MDNRPRRLAAATLGGVALALGALVTAACTSSTAGARPAIASAGLGDPYYPTDGNRGYDVLGYHVDTTYNPSTSSFRSRTTVRATATTRLTGFDLDLSTGLTVSAVDVNGRMRHSAASRRMSW